LTYGISRGAIKEALSEFQGSWRRFDKMGHFEGAEVISDYAHHPTAVRGTIEAVQELYPDKKILTIFQPHQKNRTKMLFDDFVESLATAEALILPEIYDVAGREEDIDVSALDLANALEVKDKLCFYASDISQTRERTREIAKNYDVILFMGAGDIHDLASELASGAND
jgi:UDP-N-acetylmuramate--alanine ligase